MSEREAIEANAEAEMTLDGIGPNQPAPPARLASSPREVSCAPSTNIVSDVRTLDPGKANTGLSRPKQRETKLA